MSHHRGVVVFDIVGTLVGFENWHTIIDQQIGAKLQQHDNFSAQMFGYTWMTHAELEYTFLCMSERYTPFKEVMRETFYRTLYLGGVQEPRTKFSDEERDACQVGYSALQLRPGAKECIETLRNAGLDVRCLTTADIPRVQGYFKNGGVDMPADKFMSCDATGIAKPALAAYRPVLEECEKVGAAWFAAGHMWDVAAAKTAGFKGAYCSIYEGKGEDCLGIHGGAMDVIAESLPDMAQQIVDSLS